MDLLYSDFCFRRYFNFVDKYRDFESAYTMQDKRRKLLQVIDSLKPNCNEIQMSCCMNELVDSLSEVTKEEILLLECGESYVIVLDIMSKNIMIHDLQYYGVFALFRLMEESLVMRRKLISLGVINFIIKLMQHYSNDAIIQEVSCSILVMLLEDAEVKQHINTKSAIEAILHAMKNFEQKEELQIPALQALTKLMQMDLEENWKEIFVQQKFHILVLEILEDHIESVEVTEQAFLLLNVLVMSSCICEQLLYCDVSSVVLNGMQNNVDSCGLQNAGIDLLKFLASNDSYQEVLVHNNISNTVLKTMENHKRSNVLQKNSIEVFCLICKTLLHLSCNKKEITQYWLEHILVAMATHCDDPSILIVSCSAITKLSVHHPRMLMLLGDDDHGIPLHNSIMAALALHTDNAEVCQASCETIGCIAALSSAVQQSLFTKGVYLYIIQAMKLHRHEGAVQQYGCQSLRKLCMPNVENMNLIVQFGAWDVITNCLVNFTEDAIAQEEAIAIIALLSTEIELLRHQCAAEHVYLAVLNAMKKFPNNETLIEVAFEAIGVFAAHEAMFDLLVQSKAVNTFLNAMKTHTKKCNIQQKGCILIQAFSSYIKEEQCVSAVSAIIRAMQQFSHDECVQEESCVALRLIAQVDTNNSVVLVNQCAHERLFAILDEFSDESKVIELASDVLWLLGCYRNYSSLMLLSACAGGLIKGAHCLLQVGADVNAGEGTNTPLCAACKNNKDEMVRYLLTQGISDVQTALNLCLEMEHHNIVGILLQKLGHDREAGVISWNGLNLGSLHPEWLFPALSGSAFGLSIESRRWCDYLQNAENAFIQRFKILEKLLDVTVISNIMDRNVIMSTVIPDAPEESDDSSEEDETFSTISEDDQAKFKILSAKSPLRTRSISGASLPYSSYDPRVVVPLNVGDPILLPKRSPTPSTEVKISRKTSPPCCDENAHTDFRISSHIRRRSKSMLSMQTVSEQPLQDNEGSLSYVRPRSIRRTVSDVDKSSLLLRTPSFELTGHAFMYYRRNRKLSSGRQNRRKTVYSAFPSANGASVRVIDVSGNRISELSPLVEAGDSFLRHLRNIHRLELSNNDLSSFPTELCEAMPLLEQLNLNHNKFEKFPYGLQQCKRLKILDLSYNNLELSAPASPFSSVLLEHLLLANNSLKEFPEWLADFFPGLTKLTLAGNEIEKLPENSLKMPRLRILDLSHNKIDSIPEMFLVECGYLENLNASFNELSTIPETTSRDFTHLRTLRLAHNNLAQKAPFFIPRFILMVPNLKVLDLSHNKLTHLPSPDKWTTKQLKELVVSHNNIKRIHLDTDVNNWRNLERLLVSHNNLKDVPKGIGCLSSLTSLDLSDNPGISSLPDEMGQLSNLWDLQLNGIKLDIEEALLNNTKNLIAFLHSKLMNSVPYYRMKLVIVGLGGRGKTTLLNQLLKSKATPSHNELVIRDWIVRDSKATCKHCHHKSVIYTISTWDFKGRQDLYHVYQGLMSSRSLYLAVYDVTKGGQELEDLRPWLQSIHTCAPDVPVMLVGTHLDRIPKERYNKVLEEMKDRARSLFSSAGLPEIRAHVVLNCTQETPGIQTLRNKIVDLVVKCKCPGKGQPILGSHVPQSFVRLQRLILSEVETLGQRIPVLRTMDIKKLLLDNEVIMSEGELGQAVKLLNEAGVLVHYDDPVAHLNDLFFVQPEWLCHVISSVVTVPSWLITNGVLNRKDLVNLIKDEKSTVKLPYDLLPQFLRLLERFGVLLPISESEFLMPSRLQSRPKVDLPSLTLNTYYRRLYRLAYIPLGFWARLLTRLLLFTPTIKPREEASYESPSIDYWCDGIQVKWSTQSFFWVFQDLSAHFGPNVLAIVVPSNDYGFCLLASLVDHVDTLIEDWFPGLCCVDPVQCLQLVTRMCPCIKCDQENSHVFTLDECIEQALSFEEIACPKTSELLPIEKVAPDVALVDLKFKKFLINEEELVLKQNKDFVLGDGGFGTVYNANYLDKVVAVKVFHTEGDFSPYRLLRQEVPFLAQLHHPSIISMFGVYGRPRALVLEKAPLGSLSSQLSKGEKLSRSLQHRIALQIAEGLAYLHHHNIVYRDLKPHNILIFSLSLSIVINAKISDFGIARYTTLYGLKSSEGTPGYRAPEVARGDVGYNKQADMYSFGMFLYELVTSGRRPFEDLRFRNELDAAVMQGRMVDPITDSGSSPWPDVADLIEHLLEPRADLRPTADQVFERLSKADLLCLKRDVPVCKEQTVECMTVRNYTENNQDKIEIWIGSGLSEDCSGQVSWVNLTDRESEGCQGTVIRDKRVKCIIAIRSDIVLVGTQSGKIWVFDASSHQCLHALQPLPDSVVALKHYNNMDCYQDMVIAGLADGQLAIYQTKDLMNERASRQMIQLCHTIEDGGQCNDDCTNHSVACLAIAQKSIFCGCGNDIVVLKIDTKIEFKRRWSIEGLRKGIVRDVVVGKYVWTSTKDSPFIDYWDTSHPILRGTVNCRAIMTQNGFEGESHDIRVVCLMLHGKYALWIGLGTGHVILLSPSTCETLCILNRHSASVRCMAIARGPTLGRPGLIMTGGMGFIRRPGLNVKKANGQFGHVLVWDANLGEQVKELSAHLHKRHQEQLQLNVVK